jgi:hypothetical protein
LERPWSAQFYSAKEAKEPEMTRQEEIAAFVDTFCPLPREQFPYSVRRQAPLRRAVRNGADPFARDAVESLANHFLALPEFAALRLGGLFGTVDGQLIAEAVELVTPPLYREDIQLLVDALVYAANEQKKGNQRAGMIALGAVAGSIMLAVAISRSSGA